MSTDKTLADVQPGGRVRLGDALPPLPKMEHIGRVVGMGPHDTWYEPVAYTAEQMQDYARAALAARQPVTMDEALAAGDGTLHGAIDHWQERALRAEAELAARQPVGEPVPFAVESKAFETHAASRDLNLVQHPLHYLFLDPVTVEARRAWKAALAFAQPAQAVDLGRWSQRHADDLHVAVHTALGVHAGSLSQKKRAAISAYVKRMLIDSQAVGNK